MGSFRNPRQCSPSVRPFLQQDVGDDKSTNDKEDVDTEKTRVCARELRVVHQYKKNCKRAQCLDIGSKSLSRSLVCRTTWFDRDNFCRMVLHVKHPLDFWLTNHDTKFGSSRYVKIFGVSATSTSRPPEHVKDGRFGVFQRADRRCRNDEVSVWKNPRKELPEGRTYPLRICERHVITIFVDQVSHAPRLDKERAE